MPEHVKILESGSVRRVKPSASRRWLAYWMPPGADTQSHNMRSVLLDGLGVGFASAAGPFLPILLTHLGGSDAAVGLLTALPALAGLLFALPVSRFLSRQRYIVPWFSAARLLVISGYALCGLATMFNPDRSVIAILCIWALATLPQTIVDVSFNLVMAGVAGPDRRFYLMSRRWSSLGIVTAITVAATGWALDRVRFPLDYQIVFPILALGGLVSYYYSSRIRLPAQSVSPTAGRTRQANPNPSFSKSLAQLRAQSKFLRFTASQFVFRFGLAWALPLFPLYYVHGLEADNAAIGLINTVNSAVLLVAYFMWSRISRRRGVRFALLATTCGIGLYPIALAMTNQVGVVIALAGLAGIFSAGIDLVFFDRLMSSIPSESGPMFMGWYQTTVYIATFIAPLVGTGLAQIIGLQDSLIIAGILRLAGFGLFAYLK